MAKDNKLMLGFESVIDLLSTSFNFKLPILSLIVGLMATLNTFISENIYNDAKSIYFLLGLIMFDAVTGVLRAIKAGTFSSSRLPRILVIMLLYTGLLSVSHNLTLQNPYYSFLPGLLYGGFIATLVTSVFENMHELGYISTPIFNLVMRKIRLVQEFMFGKSFVDETTKNKKEE
jgi:hypothetical protein